MIFFIFCFEQLSEIQTSKFFFVCREIEFKQFNKCSGLFLVGMQIEINIYLKKIGIADVKKCLDINLISLDVRFA